MRVLPQHRALETRARRHHAARAHDAVGPHARARLDHRVLADEARPLEHRAAIHPRAGHTQHAARPAIHAQIDAAVHRVDMRLQIGRHVADIAPVAAHRPGAQPVPPLEQLREQIAAEIIGRLFGNHVQHLRLKDVYARVDRVGKHLAPARLFDKALHASVRIGDDHAVLERIFDVLYDDRSQRALPLMPLIRRREIAVGHAVAREHDERLVQKIARLTHAARRAERRFFYIVAHVHPEARAVAQPARNALGQIHQRRRGLAYAVALKQLQRVAQHRPVHQRHHGLGPTAR